MNKLSIEETLHKVATGDWSIDRGCMSIEAMHRESRIGQQSTIFDTETHHDKNVGHSDNTIDSQLTAMKFHGSNYVEVIDKPRLQKQYIVIRDMMQDGKWRTLREIEDQTGYPQASISAQLRNLRKESFGGHTIDKRRRGVATQGLFEYKLKCGHKNIDGSDGCFECSDCGLKGY